MKLWRRDKTTTLRASAEQFGGVAAAAFKRTPDAKFAAFEAGELVIVVARGPRGEAVRRLIKSWGSA